jgi:hypothetical protein
MLQAYFTIFRIMQHLQHLLLLAFVNCYVIVLFILILDGLFVFLLFIAINFELLLFPSITLAYDFILLFVYVYMDF